MYIGEEKKMKREKKIEREFSYYILTVYTSYLYVVCGIYIVKVYYGEKFELLLTYTDIFCLSFDNI